MTNNNTTPNHTTQMRREKTKQKQCKATTQANPTQLHNTATLPQHHHQRISSACQNNEVHHYASKVMNVACKLAQSREGRWVSECCGPLTSLTTHSHHIHHSIDLTATLSSSRSVITTNNRFIHFLIHSSIPLTHILFPCHSPHHSLTTHLSFPQQVIQYINLPPLTHFTTSTSPQPHHPHHYTTTTLHITASPR